MDEAPSKLPRLQFTIARLMACTVFVALAAWTATVDLPFGLTISPLGDRDVLPFILACSLLAAAFGALVEGKPGALAGCQIGAALTMAGVLILVPICVMLWEFVRWLW